MGREERGLGDGERMRGWMRDIYTAVFFVSLVFFWCFF